MRLTTLVCCLMLIVPEVLAGQDPPTKWTGALDAGYSRGLGDAFAGQGALSTHIGGYRTVGPAGSLGLELGYTRFASLTSIIPDIYGPGSLQREDFRRSLWSAIASLRARWGAGPWRPYAQVGLGAYLVRVQDKIVTTDAAGAPLPALQFEQTASEVKPGVNVLLGLQRARVFGGAGLGVQARWDGVLSSGVANVVSVGFALILD
jgi:hypothetical protein